MEGTEAATPEDTATQRVHMLLLEGVRERNKEHFASWVMC